MEKISAVIIAGNEEQNIARCLESLSGLADEIIVLNSFSEDKTAEICNKFQVRFFQREWEGYSAAKNYANSLSRHQWILSIDADEALSEELRLSIAEIKSSSTYDAYRFNRLNSYCGKWIRHGAWYPDKKIRLWRNGIARWEGAVHEELVFSKQLAIGELPGNLLHFTLHNYSEHLRQIDKFSSLWAEEAYRKGKKAGLFAILFKPITRFMIAYFFKAGFMDGYTGWIIARMSSMALFLRLIKLRALNIKNEKK